MRGRIADGDKGLVVISIVVIALGIVGVGLFLIFGGASTAPALIIGIFMISVGTFALIPHKYIDKKVVKETLNER